MEILQLVLVYLTLTISVGYLVKKFLLPKTVLTFFGSKKTNSKACGEDGCGCH
jgi:hypothetical protein